MSNRQPYLFGDGWIVTWMVTTLRGRCFSCITLTGHMLMAGVPGYLLGLARSWYYYGAMPLHYLYGGSSSAVMGRLALTVRYSGTRVRSYRHG